MRYKIAVASEDGVNIDMSFGAAPAFDIYEAEGTAYCLAEKRAYVLPDGAVQASTAGCVANQGNCGNGTGGCCGSAGVTSPKVQLIRDCRCVICKKVGFQVSRQLENLAIMGFDVDCTVEEALAKITAYLEKADTHQSLSGIQSPK